MQSFIREYSYLSAQGGIALSAILDFFKTFFNVIGSFISSTIWALGAIPKMATSLGAVYAYAPQFLQYALVLCLSLTITMGVIRFLK